MGDEQFPVLTLSVIVGVDPYGVMITHPRNELLIGDA